MPDDNVMVCYECQVTFTTWTRRHHCRMCGQIFCYRCSANQIHAPSGDNLRVCTHCFEYFKERRKVQLQNLQSLESEASETPLRSSVYKSSPNLGVSTPSQKGFGG
jgi:NMD protein affecting ribosome stability and mRNA decay